MQTQISPLSLGFSLSFLGEAGELRILYGGLLNQKPGKLQHCIRGGYFIGVNVGIHNGYLIVLIPGALKIFDYSGSGFLGPVREIQPFIYGCAVTGNDEVGHIIAEVGLAHHTVLYVGLGCSAVIISFFSQPIQLVIDLPHGMEGGIRLDGDLFK